MSSEALCTAHLILPLYDGNYAAARQSRNTHEHEADRPGTNDCDGISLACARFLKASHDAGQRLRQSSMLKGNVVRENKRVLLNNAGRNRDVLGIGTIVEEQIGA